MKHSAYAAISLLAAILIWPSSDLRAQDAEGTLEKNARTGEFVIGYRTDASPLSYENADGEPSGYSVDLCRRIAAGVKAHLGKHDIETKFVPVTSDERISAVVSGKIDIECGSTTITLSRQEQLRNYLQQNLIDAELVIEAVDSKNYSLVSETFSYEPYGFAVRRNDADFRLVANRAITQLYRSGQHIDIFYKWIGRSGIQPPPILITMYQLSTLPE